MEFMEGNRLPNKQRPQFVMGTAQGSRLPRSASETDRLPEIRSTKVPTEFAKHAVEFREF